MIRSGPTYQSRDLFQSSESYSCILFSFERHFYIGDSNISHVLGSYILSGMNYTLITDKLIVGSQPQKPEDIDHLKQEENVAYILNLQQDKDIEYWGIDFQSILKRCKELGIRHMRRPVRFTSLCILVEFTIL